MASARWLLGGRGHSVVEVEVPPGPLGIMLDGDDLDRPVLEGFAQISPNDPQQRGAVELSGRVVKGSLLVGVDDNNFMESDLSFEEVGAVLQKTSSLPRTLKFLVPMAEQSNNKLPLSQQFAPRRGPPPREEEESDEESDKESEDEVQAKMTSHKYVMETQDSNLPLSQQYAPRRGPPPREEEESDEEEEESEDEWQVKKTSTSTYTMESQDSNVPLNQQYAPWRGPPPREEEESEEEVDIDEFRAEKEDNMAIGSSSSAGDSFQEIQMTDEVILASAVHASEDQASDGSTSWTLTGSNLDGSSTTPLASSVSSASPEKYQQVTPPDTLQEFVTVVLQQPSPEKPQQLSLEIDTAPSIPKELSFGTMAKLAETRHFDSDDSSDSDDDSEGDFDHVSSRGISLKAAQLKAPSSKTVSSFSDHPEELSPQKPSSVPLSMASNVSSGTIAASLMMQTNQFDRDDSVEEDDAEYVTVVAPSGPLGLNLDGGVLDRAVVMGFVKLRDGSKGALERNGDIVPGSVIVRIDGEDVSHASLHEIGLKLSELSQQPRTLVFRLPPRPQQGEQHSNTQPIVMRRSPTLPPFKEDFDKRRKLELALVLHFDKQVLPRRDCWFCVDAQWMARWVDFVCRGGPEPGPISNETLLHDNWRKMLAHDSPGRPDTAREGLVLMKDYRVVVPMVWCLFAELHGLGEAPLLARYPMDIYAEALTDGEVSKILQIPRPKATVLANDLRDKCLVRPSKKQ
ncbi:hypothetical protein V7S43_012547 [Phytophthora oleae]|uniref:DUSP domain-containing protein n=1 Tax=Phytophthora oleae TaxID=2107226 RepID=A0ABD3F951_9STRA